MNRRANKESVSAQHRQNQILLTPGPLTTSAAVKSAMARDWASRDDEFVALTAELRTRLLDVVDAADTHVAIPIAGSGTFAIEATIATLMRRGESLLVVSNGIYGDRIAEIAERLDLNVILLRDDEGQQINVERIAETLSKDSDIGYVALVHCETATGVLNPLPDVAAVVAEFGRRLILDAMSSFGALPIDLSATPTAAVVASSNKCLEGVPGVGFALIERSAIASTTHRCSSLSLDLVAQWEGFQTNGQWRFTPPVQVVAALVEALRGLAQEGGSRARLGRYQDNAHVLKAGMTKLGFQPFLDEAIQSPIILTFLEPTDAWFSFAKFYNALANRGYLIYPGKTTAATFRVGCIGAITSADIKSFLSIVTSVVEKMKESHADESQLTGLIPNLPVQ